MTEPFDMGLVSTASCVEADQCKLYDSELDNVNSLLADVCDVLEASRCVIFVVRGFGEESWPVDVRTDLLTVLQQLPEIATAIRTGELEFELSFYEQGLGRTLNFRKGLESYAVSCISQTSWTPSPGDLTLSVGATRDMFARLRADFLELASKVCPSIAAHPWLLAWAADSNLSSS